MSIISYSDFATKEHRSTFFCSCSWKPVCLWDPLGKLLKGNFTPHPAVITFSVWSETLWLECKCSLNEETAPKVNECNRRVTPGSFQLSPASLMMQQTVGHPSRPHRTHEFTTDRSQTFLISPFSLCSLKQNDFILKNIYLQPQPEEKLTNQTILNWCELSGSWSF